MIPCKNCLILGLCKNKNKIECRLLSEWMDAGDTRTRRKKYDKTLFFLFNSNKEEGRLVSSRFITSCTGRSILYFLKPDECAYKEEVRKYDTL